MLYRSLIVLMIITHAMKKFFLISTYFIFPVFLNAQYKEIDEKIEFLGIPFLSAPDYSRITFLRTADIYNVYSFIRPNVFTATDYTLPSFRIAIAKGRVMNFICEIENDEIFSKINRDLTNTFQENVLKKEGTIFHGTNLAFYTFEIDRKKWFLIMTRQSDTIPDFKDKNGIIDLLGKKDTDPEVAKFITSIPGKKEKQEYDNGGYGLTWAGEGIVVEFTGKEGKAVLNNIMIYFMKDNYYWRKTAFKETIKLPYGITANTSLLQLRDMFGVEDRELGSSWRTKNYAKFKVYCNFGDPVKQIKSELLNHITFK